MAFSVAQSIFQLCLLGSFITFTDATVSSCANGAYLAGVDTFRVVQTVDIPQADTKVPETTEVFIGNESSPTIYKLCSLQLSESSCPPFNQTDGCFCKHLGLAATNDVQEYEIIIQLPLASTLNSYSILMRWNTTAGATEDLFLQEIPQIFGQEQIELTINDKRTAIVGLRCPVLPKTWQAKVKLCVYNLQLPLLQIHFDDTHHYNSTFECMEKSINFQRNHLGKPFWLSFQDQCKRHGTISCRYPNNCCGRSPPVQLALLAVLMMSSQLAKVM